MRLRSSGVLLHISSLPSPYGIGDIGPAAHDFARLLASNGQSLWQFLPLNPTSPAIGNSPYSSPSAFAGNILYISPELLLEEGFVTREDLDRAGLGCPCHPSDKADYSGMEGPKAELVRLAFERNAGRLAMDSGFTAFVDANRHWLDDYVRFMSIKEAHGGAVWTEWPEPLARRDPAALAAWDAQEGAAMQRQRFAQYLFYRQWQKLREHCTGLGVRLVGDVPIYVTHDSADVWADRRLFQLDEAGRSTVVAGVPPDYFSPTGQRWGNPLYNWETLRQEDFAWWVRRVTHNLNLFDCVRLDHFRGFAGYWEIPASEPTAINGRWVDAPGKDLFATLARKLLSLPIIAEDLGVITADVRELQQSMGFPGMAVLQFGFGGNLAENPHTPFMQRPNQVVYTGTHDNAPTRGWFAENASDDEKYALYRYIGSDVSEGNICRIMMRLALGSVADMAVIPMQDILDLGMASRMNTPSTVEGNWTWRLLPGQASAGCFEELASLSALFGRHSGGRS